MNNKSPNWIELVVRCGIYLKQTFFTSKKAQFSRVHSPVKLDISGKDPVVYGELLADTTLYKRLYGCDNLDYRTDYLRAAENDTSPEVGAWLAAVQVHATEIEVKAFDFGDLDRLRKDEETLEQHERYLRDKGDDLLPYQLYTVRDLAILIRNRNTLNGVTKP
jgi:hypothetical protein